MRFILHRSAGTQPSAHAGPGTPVESLWLASDESIFINGAIIIVRTMPRPKNLRSSNRATPMPIKTAPNNTCAFTLQYNGRMRDRSSLCELSIP